MHYKVESYDCTSVYPETYKLMLDNPLLMEHALVLLLTEFQMFYKMEHAKEWSSLRLNSILRSMKVEDLQCGTKYKFYMTAENILGVGKASEEITASTKGSGKDPVLVRIEG